VYQLLPLSPPHQRAAEEGDDMAKKRSVWSSLKIGVKKGERNGERWAASQTGKKR